jgi:hypothetical protein
MADASRLLYYWGWVEDTSILSMPRTQWHDLVGHLGKPIPFDVRSTPMSAIANSSFIIATLAHQFGEATARVSIFRDDPTDAPLRINVDHYKVWTDLSGHPRLTDMIEAASTPYNENMKTLIEEHVFLVKEKPGPDHWMDTLPASITLVLERMTVDTQSSSNPQL